jgi:hypothetical protein
MRHLGINPANDIKHLVSLLLALIPLLALYFIIPPINSVIDLSLLSVSVRMILISAIVVSVTAVSCYFICRHNPASAWYVPVVVTGTAMWMISDLLSNYWTGNTKLWLLVAALLLATISGILGSLKGEQIPKKQ